MNASQWETSDGVNAMLKSLFEHRTGEAGANLHLFHEACGERRLGLFAVACCRGLWPYLTGPSTRQLLETVEQYLDGLVCEDALAAEITATFEGLYEQEEERSRREAQASESVEILLIQVTGHSLTLYGDIRSGEECYEDIEHRLHGLRKAAAGKRSASAMTKEAGQQSHLLRDIFGNPFRPPLALDPTWLAWNDGLIVRMANAIYEERSLPAGHLDHTRLAVLADALTDAGCTDADLIEHLRGPGPHVRGCWAVDLLTGRK